MTYELTELQVLLSAVEALEEVVEKHPDLAGRLTWQDATRCLRDLYEDRARLVGIIEH